MGKKLVRQFKSHKTPAGARGYRPQAIAEHPPLNPPAAVVDYGVPSIDHGVQQRPPVPPTPPVVDLSVLPEIPMLVPAQIPRTMGTPALPPDWYPETPNRIWTPQKQSTVSPRLRRNTGEEDVPINIPSVNLPTTTTTPQRPYPPYTQPNVGVDTTAEIYNLPPQQQAIYERPTTIDYGPITTPIARPVQEDAGYIEPQQSYPITPGPQIIATEQSFYEPQPVESAYAYPIQVDYPQPQPQNPDLNQDEITNLIDTLIPEQQETRTVDLYEEGPQWVEDPQALAAQEIIDAQIPFDQIDPSIYQPQPTIDEIPELTDNQPQPEDPFVIDYGPTYGDPVLQETTQTPYLPPVEQFVQELPITRPPEMGMPEIPVETSVDETDGTVAGGVQAGDDFYWEDRSGGKIGRGGGGGHQTNITEAIPGGPIVRDPEGATAIASDITTDAATDTATPAKTITPEGVVVDDPSKTYTVDTSAGIDIEQLPEASITGEVAEGPMVDPTEATGPVADPEPYTPEIADPLAPENTRGDDSRVPPVTATPGQGGRKWLHTGPTDFAETLHQFKINRGSSGPPIVTDTPAVSGPVVNRETGEITREPLTWHQFNPAGSSVSPYTEGINTGTETGAKGQPDVTGVSATSGTGRGGEGRTPFQTFLENQDNAGELIPGGLNLDMASLKGQAGINQLRSEMTAKDFEGIDSFEGLGNFFNLKPAFQGFGNSIAGTIQELTGMEAGDLKGPGLWDTLNTPIPALSTDEFGITPLDIITVIASGTVAIGPILVKKFMDSLMQPFEAAVTDGLKGVFNTVFKRGGENYNKQPVSQENINAADLEVLAEELGIDKPSGMIEAGTYYGADGTVIARNMKPLDFGVNTVDSANSFKDVLHAVGAKADPGYTSIKYNTQTGQVDVVHADGSVTENASHITIDSEGNMQQGTGNSKKTEKVNWGVKVIGVNAIDTVAPRKDKGKGKGKGGSIWDWIKDKLPGKDDDEDDTTKKESGN